MEIGKFYTQGQVALIIEIFLLFVAFLAKFVYGYPTLLKDSGITQ